MQLKRTTITVAELDCAAEQAVLQKRLSALPEVASVEFDLLNRRLTVTHDFADENVLHKAIRSLGMTPAAVSLVAGASGTNDRVRWAAPGSGSGSRQRIPLAVSGALAFGSEIAAWTSGTETSLLVIVMASASIVIDPVTSSACLNRQNGQIPRGASGARAIPHSGQQDV